MALLLPHAHVCIGCGFAWACLLVPRKKQTVCDVDAARKSNKTGPFCELCRHLALAVRVALLRKLSIIQLSAALLDRYHAERGT